jgi:hypothetical protein
MREFLLKTQPKDSKIAIWLMNSINNDFSPKIKNKKNKTKKS